MFSPLLLPPHRSARAERPEAGGRSGEEAPGSPRRGRLGPPPRSAPLCSWQPGSHSASESQRRRAPAPPANQRAGGARRRAANRRGFKGARAAEGSGREAGGALAPVGLRARARAPPGVEKAVCGRPPALSFCQTPLSSQSPSCPLARYVPAGFRTPERVP